ncbi:Cysteine-rich receptor-like protein kinase 2 [Camellia lanceoleosa]|uniref:Cysteine-rich receptor-like protein kinase 2 n=1 Tax=Camellia lanceoleosa TaxID=1840588 RepID=A0ACC0J1E0_9ERIC|nr:Cysteine-rich receptor-like protein kinase 2 [Camellia lanceoleosa]
MAVMVVVAFMSESAMSDPEINLLNKGCSQYNATNLSNFFSNLNATFSDLRSQISSQNKKFATAQKASTSDPVYAMVQCRDYLSVAHCVSCFDAAVSQIRNCSAANGARVIYDGCFLRYESNGFYDQGTLPGNVGVCGNRTVSQATAFYTAVQGVLTNLKIATPKINGFFAATKSVVVSSSTTVYAVSQCAETISESSCQDCLTVAYANIQICPPNADGRAVDAGCFLRYSDTAFFADNQTTNINPFLGGGGGSSKKNAIIGGVVGSGGCLLLIVAMILWHRLSRRSKLAPRGNILGASKLQGPAIYRYKDLKSATKNFSEENKLGEGGFGDVYKGTLENGNIIAVKKLAISSSRAKADFESEVKIISNVHHRNLIRLLGCSNRGPDLLLVYEYMANGSLDRFLYGERKGALNWKQRFDIIFGIARGLAYLHEQFHVCIIHRDIKSSNILLDDDFQPKIADFGLVRLLPEDQSHLSTGFAGTLGYTAPEYAVHGQLSEKVDTYSFGIVVLEIVSGRRCNEMTTESTEFLLEQAWKLYKDGIHLKLVDETLDTNEYRGEEMKKVIEIALMCTQSPVSTRPTMSEVVVLLVSDRSMEVKKPTQPTLIDKDKKVHNDTNTTTSSSTSNATASFTEFAGR